MSLRSIVYLRGKQYRRSFSAHADLSYSKSEPQDILEILEESLTGENRAIQ